MIPEKVASWLIVHYIEVLATITGLFYLGFSIKEYILLWPFGIITSLLYVFICFESGIYADMGVNAYYVIISIYGWWHWVNKPIENEHLLITRVSLKLKVQLIVVTLLIFIFIAIILKQFTNSTIVGWDAFTTALSITATWMLARKILEHWLVWIIVDSVSVALYFYKELYPTVFLFIVYTFMAIVGFYEWRKNYRLQIKT